MQNALEIGKAAEHLVCADLILQGRRAFLSDQGLPFDLIVEDDGRLIRVQVKATLKPKNVNATGKNERMAYSWSVRRRGRDSKGERLSTEHCDIVALVALDVREIAYFPLDLCSQTVQIDAEKSQTNARGRGWAATMKDFPFGDAVAGDVSRYRDRRKVHVPGEPKPRVKRTYEQSKRYRETQRARIDKLRGVQRSDPKQVSGPAG